MKIQDLINALNHIRSVNGDVDVLIKVIGGNGKADGKISIDTNYNTGYVVNADSKIIRITSYLQEDELGNTPVVSLRKDK